MFCYFLRRLHINLSVQHALYHSLHLCMGSTRIGLCAPLHMLYFLRGPYTDWPFAFYVGSTRTGLYAPLHMLYFPRGLHTHCSVCAGSTDLWRNSVSLINCIWTKDRRACLSSYFLSGSSAYILQLWHVYKGKEEEKNTTNNPTDFKDGLSSTT